MNRLEERFEALKNWLIEEEEFTEEELADVAMEDAYNGQDSSFEILGNEYLVLTDDEADEEAYDRIQEELWAFNADFILEHTEFYGESTDTEDHEFIRAMERLQESIAEGANAIVKALIVDMDEFVEDAIDADGRGHAISYYDGEEYEFGDFFIYQIG